MAKRTPKPWYRRGRGWFVTIQGKQIQLTDGDRNAANEALEALKRLLATGGTKQTGKTGAEAVAAYLDAIDHRVKPQTMVGYKSSLSWFVKQFGTVPVGELEPVAIEKAVTVHPDWSDSHRANLLWLIQSCVQWAGRPDFKLHRPQKESRSEEVVIPEEIYKRILRETTGDFQQFIRVIWATGARPSELLGLTAESIDFAAGTATRKQHKTARRGKRRILYFSPVALEVLKQQVELYPDGPLFRGRYGEQLTPYKISRRFTRLGEKFGVRICAVGFRHSYATRALSAGTADAHVAALLGHASTSMIHRHYSHLAQNAKLLKDVAAKLDDAA